MSDRNIFQKIADKIVDFAPEAAAAVLSVVPGVGTIPAAALTALSSLGKACGLGTTATAEQVFSAVSIDPEIKLKAMLAENDFKLEMRKQDSEDLKTEVTRLTVQIGDVQNARNNATVQVQATGKRDINLYVLAWVIMGGFIGLIIAIIVLQYATGRAMQNDPMLMLLVGSLSTDAGMVVGYFFGSSKSSQDKTELLAKADALK